MIYLDNAATTMRKPQEVVDAVVAAMGSLGNAGRGASAGALDAGRMVLRCREAMAHLLGCPRADHVCFSANSTSALNAAISGLVGPGDRVVTTVLEHNSVLRPLARLADERGAEVAYAGCDAHGFLDMDDLERLATPGTRLVAVTHGSNVTGNLVDVARVAELAHAVGALVVVDASQTAGAVPLDMASMGLDVVCFTGHKGLMGPQGTGGMAVAEGVEPRPWAEGAPASTRSTVATRWGGPRAWRRARSTPTASPGFSPPCGASRRAAGRLRSARASMSSRRGSTRAWPGCRA